MTLNKNYWEKRYQNNDAGWDTGSITTPLKDYIDQLQNKDLKILIPGAGNGYEFDYLVKKDFKNIYVIDIAKNPIASILSRNSNYKEQIIEGDFFNLTGAFDLIIEQTFFCALDPILREQYAHKVHSLLKPKGKVVGLLFDFPLTETGPPFGGSLTAYQDLFSKYFEIKILEKAYNSIKPRFGSELFFIFEKK